MNSKICTEQKWTAHSVQLCIITCCLLQFRCVCTLRSPQRDFTMRNLPAQLMFYSCSGCAELDCVSWTFFFFFFYFTLFVVSRSNRIMHYNVCHKMCTVLLTAVQMLIRKGAQPWEAIYSESQCGKLTTQSQWGVLSQMFPCCFLVCVLLSSCGN